MVGVFDFCYVMSVATPISIGFGGIFGNVGEFCCLELLQCWVIFSDVPEGEKEREIDRERERERQREKNEREIEREREREREREKKERERERGKEKRALH